MIRCNKLLSYKTDNNPLLRSSTFLLSKMLTQRILLSHYDIELMQRTSQNCQHMKSKENNIIEFYNEYIIMYRYVIERLQIIGVSLIMFAVIKYYVCNQF